MTDNIIAALAKALPEVGVAIKDVNNPHFGKKYADLGSVIEAVRPVAAHGIWFRQSAVPMDGQRAGVETFYIHSSGQELSAGITDAPVSKNDAQGYGSALTYCRRYGLMAAFGIAPEDDDGNAASKAAPAKPASPAPPSPVDKLAASNEWVDRQMKRIEGWLKAGKIDDVVGWPTDPSRAAFMETLKRDFPEIHGKMERFYASAVAQTRAAG